MSRHLESDALPSYSDATSQDHWKLIAPYIASTDLCNISLACSRWHEIFSPQLWGNPASHFGTEDDSVYIALTRFRRVLPWARLYVRQMTHTLHIPAAHAELYEGPHAEWLRDMLQRLPRLQCLIVESLPFFDHSCLMALRTPLLVRAGATTHQLATTLRLLNASCCSNATYSGLALALKQFPALLWLDLSKTAAARQRDVLRSLTVMTELQVLKISDVGMKDEDLAVLAKSIGLTVRSLDISKNGLTDRCARDLLTFCIKSDDQSRRDTSDYADRPPSPSSDKLKPYYNEDFDLHLHDYLMSSFIDRLTIQDDPRSGLTHLYISENGFTVEGISGLLLTSKLHCLDAGNVSKHIWQLQNVGVTALEIMPGAEKLVNTLKSTPSNQLQYLRISHEFATREAPTMAQNAGQPSELVGDVPVTNDPNAEELDGLEVDQVPTSVSGAELDSTPLVEAMTVPAASELEGTSGATIIQRATETNGASLAIRRQSVESPERVSIQGTQEVLDGCTKASPSLRPPLEKTRQFSSFVEERNARSAYHRSHAEVYTPSLTPDLRTLVLCNIPEETPDASIPKRISELIAACAKEQSLAYAEARANYACPPGTDRKSFETQYAKSVHALERIVLEMADPALRNQKNKASAGWRSQPTSKASTEDPDSEAFWGAAQQDFTFFDEEECGQPLERETSVPSWFMDPIPVNAAADPAMSITKTSNAKATGVDILPTFNVVAEVTKYRQGRKAAKKARIKAGYPDEAVAGFWDGTVQVTRPYRQSRSDFTRDYYGNAFEKGFRYR